MTTLATVLARHHITVPDATVADIAVPILTGPQRQGDVLIVPRAPLGAAEKKSATVVPAAGVNVVRGEATGNSHILSPDPGCRILWSPSTDGGLRLGVLHVPEGETAWLIHTDEHLALGVGGGTYLLTGKRELADEIRRVAD